MPTKPCVLVVDDEVGVCTAVAGRLRAEGMDAVTVGDGPGGLRAAVSGGFDVIVLDIDLPGWSGYQMLVGLRGAGVDTPVLLISAQDGETDQVTGLDLGADGYLVKPLSLLVLVAQVRALLRRREAPPGGEQHKMRVGDLVLDPATKTATWMRRPVGLTAREYAVLHALVTRRGTVVSNSELRRMAWGRDGAVTANAVEVYIGYVRRKLKQVGAGGVVRTVHGRGYQVTQPADRPAPADSVAAPRAVPPPRSAPVSGFAQGGRR